MKEWMVARLGERSTWYGFGFVAATIATYVAPAEFQAWLAGVQFALAGGAVVTPEGRK